MRNAKGQFVKGYAPHNKTSTNITCIVCKKKKHVKPANKDAKYCSYKCYWIDKKEHIPWNKGTAKKRTCNNCGKVYFIYKKGEKYCSHDCFHESNKGEKNSMWKGDDVGYSGLHKWIVTILGKPIECKHCKKTDLHGKEIHWANKSGEYKRDINDWIRLCAECHFKFDKRMKKIQETRGY